jgi:hypothetical protein
LHESAAKASKLDIEGDIVKNISFDCPSDEAIPGPPDEFSSPSQPIYDDVSTLSSKLDEFDISRRDSVSKTIVSSTQTVEFDYMFSTSSVAPFDLEDMLDDDEVRFYTGLYQQFTLFELCLNVFLLMYQGSRKASQSFRNLIVMVLIKLRLNVSTISRTFASWIAIMDIRLSPLIYWPEREELWNTMPQRFQFSFCKRTTVIIDCFEIFIERPTNLLARVSWQELKPFHLISTTILCRCSLELLPKVPFHLFPMLGEVELLTNS